MRRLALVLSFVALAACEDKAATPGAASSSASSVAPSPPPPTAAAPPPAPADFDVAAQQKALKCATDARSGVCGVLAKFASCKAWDPIVPSGDGRWLGRGFLVEGPKTTEQFTVLRARRVPTSEVAPGQIGVKIGLGELTKDQGLAYDQADRAIRAFERADTVGKSNATLDYVKQRTEWSEVYASHTTGGQVYGLSTSGTYLCQGTGRTVLVVQRSETRANSGDGLYAELWPTSW